MIFRTSIWLLVPAALACACVSHAADPTQTEGPAADPVPLLGEPPEDLVPTVVTSDRAEVRTLEERTLFTLTGNVRVSGNNLTVFCDRLEVISLRDESEDGDDVTEGEDDGPVSPGQIEEILATGNVRILQKGREAASGRAEVYPREGKIVLTESPVIRDEQGTVAGEIITFYRGEKRAVVEGGASGPARITLPTLPDLGIDAEKEGDRKTAGEAANGN